MNETCDYCNRPFAWPCPGSRCSRKHAPADRARVLAEKLIDELSGRRGIGNEFEAIDPEIQEEIREKWAGMIRKAFAAL